MVVATIDENYVVFVVVVIVKADGLHSCNICVTIFQHVALCCIEYVSLPQIAFSPIHTYVRMYVRMYVYTILVFFRFTQ